VGGGRQKDVFSQRPQDTELQMITAVKNNDQYNKDEAYKEIIGTFGKNGSSPNQYKSKGQQMGSFNPCNRKLRP
jgi:hypothetical protein